MAGLASFGGALRALLLLIRPEDRHAGRPQTDTWVPVFADTRWVVFPQPRMKDPQWKRRMPMEVHAEQLRWLPRHPLVDGHDVLVGNQPGDAPGGIELKHEGFRLRAVNRSVHQTAVDVVDA